MRSAVGVVRVGESVSGLTKMAVGLAGDGRRRGAFPGEPVAKATAAAAAAATSVSVV